MAVIVWVAAASLGGLISVNIEVNIMSGRADDRMKLTIVARGPRRDVVHAIRADGAMPAKSFLEGLSPAEQAAFFAQFEMLCREGRLPVTKLKKFRTARGIAWELRHSRWRIGCFQNGRQWVLTHGFEKRGQRTPEREIERVERIRDEHVARNAQ